MNKNANRKEHMCWLCEGKGSIYVQKERGFPQEEVCPLCGGTGKTSKKRSKEETKRVADIFGKRRIRLPRARHSGSGGVSRPFKTLLPLSVNPHADTLSDIPVPEAFPETIHALREAIKQDMQGLDSLEESVLVEQPEVIDEFYLEPQIPTNPISREFSVPGSEQEIKSMAAPELGLTESLELIYGYQEQILPGAPELDINPLDNVSQDPFKPHNALGDPLKPHNALGDPLKPHNLLEDPLKPHNPLKGPFETHVEQFDITIQEEDLDIIL